MVDEVVMDVKETGEVVQVMQGQVVLDQIQIKLRNSHSPILLILSSLSAILLLRSVQQTV